MQTLFESMFMLPQIIAAQLSHEHPCAPIEMTSYWCQFLCAHINIDDLGLQGQCSLHQGIQMLSEFRHGGGSEGLFLQSFYA